MQQEEPNKYVKELTQEKYKYGFTTDVHTDIIERRLAGLAQSLVGGWSRGFEVPPADEPADWCHRIYRRRQYAD